MYQQFISCVHLPHLAGRTKTGIGERMCRGGVGGEEKEILLRDGSVRKRKKKKSTEKEDERN